MKKQRGMTRRERKRFKEIERIHRPLTREQVAAIEESLKEQAKLLGMLLPPIFMRKNHVIGRTRWITLEEAKAMYPVDDEDAP